MPAFHVKGVDKESGFDTELTMHADTADNARIKAEIKGIVVTSVAPHEPPAAQPPPPPPQQPPLQLPPTEHPPVAATQVIVQVPEQSGGGGVPMGFGIGAVVLGALALIASIVPIVGCLALPLAGLGAVLGLIGFLIAAFNRFKGSVVPIAGTTLSLIAFGISVFQMLVVTTGVSAVATAVSEGVAEMEKDRAVAAQRSEAEAQRRRAMFSIRLIRVAQGDLATQLSFELTNLTGRHLNALQGTVQVYDQFDERLDGLKVEHDEPVRNSHRANVSGAWYVNDRTKRLLASSPQHVKIVFDPTHIQYDNGQIERYD